jgi:hypothetical protein
MTTIERPSDTEYSAYYGGYVNSVPEGDVVAILEQQGGELAEMLRAAGEARGGFRPAPGKWSLKEVVGHVSDGERVFSYRALRIARGDATPLASFDQDAFVAGADFGRRSLSDLTDEFVAVRAATVALLRSLTTEESLRAGTASGAGVTVRALAYIIAGHERHHARAIRESYVEQRQ